MPLDWKSIGATFQSINSAELSWNSDAASDVWTNTKRSASACNKCCLAPRTSTDCSCFIPWVGCPSKKMVNCLKCHAKLRNVAFYNRNHSWIFETVCDNSIFLKLFVIPCRSTNGWRHAFYINSVLDADWDAVEEREAFFRLIHRSVFLSSLSSDLVALPCLLQCLIKHLFSHPAVNQT